MKRALVVGLLVVLAVPLVWGALWLFDLRQLTPDEARRAVLKKGH